MPTAGPAGSSPCPRRISSSRSRPAPVPLAPAGDLGVAAEARERRGLSGGGDLERAPHLARRGDDVGRPDPVADAQAGEPVDLREGAQHDQPPALADELDPVEVVGVVDVLEVGLVEDAEHVRGQPVEEREQLVAAVRGAGRVVRMADVDELRALPDRVEQRVEVVGVVAQRHRPRHAAELRGEEDVAREGGPAADDLVAGVESRLREQVDDPVCAGADDDLLERDAVPLGQRGAQREDAAVG